MRTTEEREFWNAVGCLHLAVEPSIVRDITSVAMRAFEAVRAAERARIGVYLRRALEGDRPAADTLSEITNYAAGLMQRPKPPR